MFDLNKIRAQAKKDFTETWTSTAKLLPVDTEVRLEGRGRPHLLRDLIQKSREILLNLGFDEVENLTILPDSDVSKQYGPEARVILDRVYYLAALPRPEIGLSNKKITEAKKIVQELDVRKLRGILRAYKKGEVEADNLVEELIDGLGITDHQATDLLSRVFPELEKMRPLSSNKTLRSHMTATWFYTLAAIQDKAKFPVALFSVGLRYRNEQREDAHHLRIHHSASIVIMDANISLSAGRKITEEILKQYGFSDIKVETKMATSKYYAPGQEQEVFVNYNGEWIEVADIGMYSPVSLANFNVKYPVFNAGLGIERLAMILHEIDDIRKVAYPQFSVVEFSDEEMAGSISYIASPRTSQGKKIASAIEQTARKHKDEIAPCEFLAWDDDLVEVKVVETEEGKRLIGPAGFNEICVADGTIYSDIVPSGEYSGVNYMCAIAMGVAALIENSREDLTYQVKAIKHLSDLNLQIPTPIREYIEKQQKKIGVSGAVFITVEAHFKGGKSKVEG